MRDLASLLGSTSSFRGLRRLLACIALLLFGATGLRADVTAKFVVDRYVDIPVGTDTWAINPTTVVTLRRVGVGHAGSTVWTGTYFNTSDGVNRDNKIRPGQFLRVSAAGAPAGSSFSFTAVSTANGPFTITVNATNSEAQITSLTRLDPLNTASGLVRWEATFDHPVVGVSTANLTILNNAGLFPYPALVSVAPQPNSDDRRHVVTVQIAGYGRGQIGLRYNGYVEESPAVWNVLTGDSYNVDTMTFGMAPGGSIDLRAPELWSFTTGPSPSGATMARLDSSLISIFEWGSSFFRADPNNQLNRIYEGEYLRIRAGTVTSGQVSVALGRAFGGGGPLRVNVQTPPAQVVSMNIIDPSPTVADAVRWEVVFDKAVTNVNAASFGFINSANIQPPPTVASVVAKPGAGNVRWIVTAGTPGTGTGLLSLRWSGTNGETPSVPYAFIGQTYDFSFYPNVVQDLDPTPLYRIASQPPTYTVAFENRASQTIYYQWKRGTSQNPNAATNIPGATSASYTPPSNLADGTYTYFCRGYTNSETGYYRDTLTATLNVVQPVQITAQPVSSLVPIGTTVTLSTSATGYQPQYQWFRGESGDTSSPIIGATAATYQTATLSAKAKFWVRVGNALGAAFEKASETATVTVVAKIICTPETYTGAVERTIRGLSVATRDELNQPLPDVPVTFTIGAAGVVGGSTPGGSFSGVTYVPGTLTASTVSDAQGVAMVPDLWTNTMIGSYKVRAAFSSVSSELTIVNIPGPPHNFVMTSTWPSTLVAGATFTAAVRMRDAWGNIVATAGLPVSLALERGTASAWNAPTSAVTDQAGRAVFDGIYHTRAEKVRARFSYGAVTFDTPDLAITPAAPARLTPLAGNGQATLPGTAFTSPLRVEVTDTYDNPIANRAVTFTTVGGGGWASYSPATTSTNAQGAAATNATAGSATGSYVVAANISPPLGNPGYFYLANLNALQAWRRANFNGVYDNTGDAANGASPHGEGVANLLKYAFNLNAQAADATPMTPTGTKGLPLLGTDASGRLTLTFVRRKASTNPGIVYEVHFGSSVNSGTFGPNPSATTSTPVSIDATWERVTVTDSVLPSAAARRFARVLVRE